MLVASKSDCPSEDSHNTCCSFPCHSVSRRGTSVCRSYNTRVALLPQWLKLRLVWLQSQTPFGSTTKFIHKIFIRYCIIETSKFMKRHVPPLNEHFAGFDRTSTSYKSKRIKNKKAHFQVVPAVWSMQVSRPKRNLHRLLHPLLPAASSKLGAMTVGVICCDCILAGCCYVVSNKKRRSLLTFICSC